MKYGTGAIRQGGLTQQRADYNHERVYYPVVGVILDVYAADEQLNTYAQITPNSRGYALQARVLVTKQITDAPLILPNVLVCPPTATGYDDFSEEVPKGTTGTIDGSPIGSDLYRIPHNKLNGDWCVVHFVGGSIHQPIMLSWFPHPENRRDAQTVRASEGNRVQGRRIVKRFQGTKWAVTSEGSVHLDTSEADSTLNKTQTAREASAKGGDVKVTVKQGRELEVNFNPPVLDPEEPDVLTDKKVPQIREDTASKLVMDENFIRAVAGQVAQINAANNIYLGSETADEPLVLGNVLVALLLKVLNALATHRHETPSGPSNAPAAPELADFTSAIADLELGTPLSEWIFTQKDPD